MICNFYPVITGVEIPIILNKLCFVRFQSFLPCVFRYFEVLLRQPFHRFFPVTESTDPAGSSGPVGKGIRCGRFIKSFRRPGQARPRQTPLQQNFFFLFAAERGAAAAPCPLNPPGEGSGRSQTIAGKIGRRSSYLNGLLSFSPHRMFPGTCVPYTPPDRGEVCFSGRSEPDAHMLCFPARTWKADTAHSKSLSSRNCPKAAVVQQTYTGPPRPHGMEQIPPGWSSKRGALHIPSSADAPAASCRSYSIS